MSTPQRPRLSIEAQVAGVRLASTLYVFANSPHTSRVVNEHCREAWDHLRILVREALPEVEDVMDRQDADGWREMDEKEPA